MISLQPNINYPYFYQAVYRNTGFKSCDELGLPVPYSAQRYILQCWIDNPSAPQWAWIIEEGFDFEDDEITILFATGDFAPEEFGWNDFFFYLIDTKERLACLLSTDNLINAQVVDIRQKPLPKIDMVTYGIDKSSLDMMQYRYSEVPTAYEYTPLPEKPIPEIPIPDEEGGLLPYQPPTPDMDEELEYEEGREKHWWELFPWLPHLGFPKDKRMEEVITDLIIIAVAIACIIFILLLKRRS